MILSNIAYTEAIKSILVVKLQNLNHSHMIDFIFTRYSLDP